MRGRGGVGLRAELGPRALASQGKAKKLKDLKAEKGMPSADDAPAGDDAPAAAEEAAEEAKEGEPTTPPVEEAEPAAPTPTAAAEEAPAVKAPPALPPVKTKEEAKPKAEKMETKKFSAATDESSHRDGELMHQHPKDCFLTLWPGMLSVRGPADCGAPRRRSAAAFPPRRSLCLPRGA